MANFLCRFCNSHLEHVFLDLGKTPSANSYLKQEELLEEKTYSLCVYICEECFLVQVPEILTPDELFSNYAYFSSFSDIWLEHAKKYVEMMLKRIVCYRNSK